MGSLVFDRGSRSYLNVNDTVDLDFNPRVSCHDLDIGAFEFLVLPTQITVQPTLVGRVCEGESVLLHVEATGQPGSLTFQWQRNGENLIGRTGPTLAIPNVAMTDTGYYRVIVFGACCNDTSDVVRLDVDLRPVLVAMNDTTIVSGEDVTLYIIESVGTVFWFESDKETVVLDLNLTNITESKQFFAVATNGVCTDTIIVPVSIIVDGLPCRVLTHNDTLICPGEPYRLLINEATVMARWFVVGTETEIPNGAIVRPTQTTQFVLVGFDETGEICDTDTITITVPDIQLNVRADGVFCVGSSVLLYSIPPADAWFNADNNLIGEGNITVTPPANTTTIYTAQRTDPITGCVIRRDVAITLNPPDLTLPFANFVEFGKYSLTVCEGDLVHLQTNIDPIFVVWERLSDGQMLPEDPTFIATTSDVFRAHAWDSVCGNVHVDLTLTVQPMPALEILPQPPIYLGTSITLTSIPNTPIWTDMAGTRVFMPITPEFTQSFVAILIDGFCEVRDTILVEVIDTTPTVLALEIEHDYGCFSGDGWAFVNVLSGTAPFTFVWSNGATTQLAENLQPGLYAVTVTDALGVVGTASVVIRTVSEMQIAFAIDVATNEPCDDGRIDIFVTGGQPPYFFEWRDVWTNEIVSSGQNLIGVPAGVFNLLVTDNAGCEKELQIALRCEFQQIMPSVLVTPNNDGRNDNLYIRNIEFFPINTVTIINSYGEEIARIENYNNRDVLWDGRNRRNQFVPDGTYWYVVVAEGVPPMVGWIIVRLSPGR